MGYSPQSKAYKLYNPVNGKVIISRDVVFNEATRWDWGSENQAMEQGLRMEISSEKPDTSTVSSPVSSLGTSPDSSPARSPASSPVRDPSPTPLEDSSVMPTPLPLRRSTRDSKPNSKYAANALTSCSFALLVSNLFYYEEAVTDPEWCEAIKEELMAIQKNQTWDLVTLPEGKNPIV